MATLDRSSHEREAQIVDGHISVEGESIYCVFYYTQDSKGVRITSVMHGDIDLKNVFTFSNDMFADAEHEIEEMLTGENEQIQNHDGYQTGGI